MKKNVSEIILDIIILLFGVCLVLWADKVTSILSILLGVVAIFYATVIIVNYFRNVERKYNDAVQFTFAIMVLVMGGVLIFRVDFLRELVSLIAGIYIFLSGVMQLMRVIDLKKKNKGKYTGSLVLALLAVVIGIMCIAFKFIITDAALVFIGIMLIVYSVLSIINLIMTKEVNENEEKEQNMDN